MRVQIKESRANFSSLKGADPFKVETRAGNPRHLHPLAMSPHPFAIAFLFHVEHARADPNFSCSNADPS